MFDVDVVKAVDRVTKSLVVLLFDSQVIVGIVDGFDIELLRALLDLKWAASFKPLTC